MNKAGVLKLQGEEDDIMWRRNSTLLLLDITFASTPLGQLENDGDGSVNKTPNF